MSGDRPRQIGRADAEQLLRGRPAGSDRLGDLLNAAAAPAQPHELAAEAVVMRAYRAARLDTVPTARRRSMIKTALAKALSLKVAAAAAAAVAAAGGVAYAANTGAIPALNGHANSHASPSAPVTERSRAHVRAQGSPSPSLVGLCRAYKAGVADSKGKALDNPAFTALVTAAGGKDQVDAFCVTVLGEKASHAPAAPSVRSSVADSHADARPSDHPTAEPTAHPTKP